MCVVGSWSLFLFCCIGAESVSVIFTCSSGSVTGILSACTLFPGESESMEIEDSVTSLGSNKREG